MSKDPKENQKGANAYQKRAKIIPKGAPKPFKMNHFDSSRPVNLKVPRSMGLRK
jgi:hypothetical protein